MKKDLKDLTFIIPVRIESEDRLINFKIVIDYLSKHFDTNIMIYESDKESKIQEIISQYDNIEHFYQEEPENIFHRTKYLNQMLSKVKTKAVINYDTDILLPLKTYSDCYHIIMDNEYDLIYPYFWGNSQKRVLKSGRDKLENNSNLSVLKNEDYNIYFSEYGHCMFFRTSAYIAGGMENENFISWGPEDQERGIRFKKLGYKLLWYENYVYHIEHSREINSSTKNPFYKNNYDLFYHLANMSKEDLKNYYENEEYLKQYPRAMDNEQLTIDNGELTIDNEIKNIEW